MQRQLRQLLSLATAQQVVTVCGTRTAIPKWITGIRWDIKTAKVSLMLNMLLKGPPLLVQTAILQPALQKKDYSSMSDLRGYCAGRTVLVFSATKLTQSRSIVNVWFNVRMHPIRACNLGKETVTTDSGWVFPNTLEVKALQFFSEKRTWSQGTVI